MKGFLEATKDADPVMSLESLLSEPSLRDRVVVITGGARGLGWVMAEALLKAGAKVFATGARRLDELRAAEAKAIELVGPERFVALKADVTQEGESERVIGAAVERFGAIHVLINNAARGPAEARGDYPQNPPKMWEVPGQAWRTIFDTNVNGVFYMTKAASGPMRAQGFGRIINISTSLPNMTRAGNAGYGASKAAMEVFSVQWANDLEGTGVTVNVLLPGGPTDTDLIPGDVGTRAGQGMFLHPDVMIAPALWLCSDLSNGVTGKRYIGKDWDAGLSVDDAEPGSRQQSHDFPTIM